MEKDREKFKVLFVCTGNSCRSPMAEGILKKMLKENEIDNFEVSSAGISTLDGAPASLFAMEVSGARDVDLSQHRSRQLNKQILKKTDLILAMSDGSHPRRQQMSQRKRSGQVGRQQRTWPTWAKSSLERWSLDRDLRSTRSPSWSSPLRNSAACSSSVKFRHEDEVMPSLSAASRLW